nr:hypothetical protein GCM10020092_069920 [Actinoplanes digitatis]
MQGLTRVDGDTVRARAGVGDQERGSPVPLDGHFRMGSNTKTFVSVVVLQLVGEGRLSLDDTVERWLPGLVTGNGNDGRRITVRNLLQHTSGLYNYTGDITALGSQEDYLAHRYDHYEAEDLVALATKHEPGFAPGTSWDYSNTNYILAGMIIERATGRAWATEVRARILRPLGLSHTSEPGDRPYLLGAARQGLPAVGTRRRPARHHPVQPDRRRRGWQSDHDADRPGALLAGAPARLAAQAAADGAAAPDGARRDVPGLHPRRALRPRHHVHPEPVRRLLVARRRRARHEHGERGRRGR